MHTPFYAVTIPAHYNCFSSHHWIINAHIPLEDLGLLKGSWFYLKVQLSHKLKAEQKEIASSVVAISKIKKQVYSQQEQL